MTRLLVLCGKMLAFLALVALITSASLFLLGSYIVTWPILRKSPAGRRKAAVANATMALFTLMQAFGPAEPPEDR